MRYIRPRFFQMKTWQQRLVIVFAILVCLAIVGSLTAELIHLRQHDQGNGSEIFQLRHGWTQVATYSGTGNKTITGLHLDVPYLWGNALICEGKGVTGEIDGTNSAGEPVTIHIGITPCSASSSNISPRSISLDLHLMSIRTIKFMAGEATTWHLQLTRANNQPAFTQETEWIPSGGIGGEVENEHGNAGSGSNLLPMRGANDQIILPRTYEIAFACFGSGTATIKLTPASETMLHCNRQVSFAVIRYPTATQVELMQVSFASATRDTVWSLTLLGCADEQQCGKLPATVTS